MAEPLSDVSQALHKVEEEGPDFQLNIDSVEEEALPPRSSPLAVEDEVLESRESRSPAKLVDEEMNVELENANGSSVTAIDEGLQITKDTDSPITPMTNAHSHSMPPPLIPASSMPPPSQKPPPSGQQSQNSQPRTQQHETGASETQDDNLQSSGDVTVSDDTESSESPFIGDARDELENFDWKDLEQRYHDKIHELNSKESEIMMEFDKLCSVSYVLVYVLAALITRLSSLVCGRMPDRIAKLTELSRGTALRLSFSLCGVSC